MWIYPLSAELENLPSCQERSWLSWPAKAVFNKRHLDIMTGEEARDPAVGKVQMMTDIICPVGESSLHLWKLVTS